MSIQITITADSAEDARAEMAKLLYTTADVLRMTAAPRNATVPPAVDAQLSRETDKPANADLVAGPEITASDVAQRLIDAGASPEFAAAQVQPPQKKRGPKPKNTEPAANPPSQPAAATAEPPADGASQSAAETKPETPSPAVSADPLSFDAFKKKLNEMQSSGPNALAHITAGLLYRGYQKVKDVKPEHYADVIAKAEELIAADGK